MMTASEIREQFLKYFEGKRHTIVPSSPLIPLKDPTLLFTNAGMVQFKSIFTGEEKHNYTRAVSSQKCMRAGGKHNDLENVGHTARHHTFFEMLGNFSFGDYFKQEAIELSWEFLTSKMNLPQEKLWISVYQEDDEAFSIWHKRIGVPDEKIVRMGEKDNFWAMGETGPCGPCSEILIDQGEEVGCGKPTCKVGCECDRFLELWNLVFMQFNRDAQGKQSPLPKPCIDTGMGLERITAVVQRVKSNYEIDLFQPLINQIEDICHIKYGSNRLMDTSIRVIVDHMRAITFLINDGVLPSNEGRGYVLRRIIRRAARHGKKLRLNEPFLCQSCKVVTRVMGDAYPELADSQTYVARVVQGEEERFAETLDNGLKILSEEVERLKEQDIKQISGEIAFKLYDTYGFPLDLTADVVSEEGFTIDDAGFQHAMEAQRERARKSWRGSGEEEIDEIFKKLSITGKKSTFTGYDQTEATSPVLVLIKRGREVASATEGDELMILTEQTPFYGESGGQAGDTGVIESENILVEVQNTIRPLPEIILHKGIIKKGSLHQGEPVNLKVDSNRRTATALNHTATHLLQAALRQVLGDHVKQSGSLVTPERFRFDFTHFAAVSREELDRVEAIVNQRIRKNYPVETDIVPYQQATQMGAIALFGEKYSEMVRMVKINSISIELCGGTHVHHTGNIGLFKLIGESGIAAGIRRIEALTGEGAIQFIKKEERELKEISGLLKAQPDEVVAKTSKILEEQKKLQKEIEALKNRMFSKRSDTLMSQARNIKGIKVVATCVEADNAKTLREFADQIKEQLKSGIIIVGGKSQEKALVVVVVTKDLIPPLHAGKIIQGIAKGIGGSGGGRADMAQAGGKEKQKLVEVLERAYSIVEEMIP
jgi:alanyl-tRNA synthetase